MAEQTQTQKQDGQPGHCPTCGEPGHFCFGPSKDGPSHEDWIGVSEGKPCCHACHEDGKEWNEVPK